MLIQVYLSSCIGKVALVRNQCGILCGSSVALKCVQEEVGKVKR